MNLNALDREPPKSLKDKMRNLEKSMEQLLPLAFSDKKLSEKEASEIKQNVLGMLADVKELEGHFSLGDSRIPFMCNLLK